MATKHTTPNADAQVLVLACLQLYVNADICQASVNATIMSMSGYKLDRSQPFTNRCMSYYLQPPSGYRCHNKMRATAKLVSQVYNSFRINGQKKG